MAASTAANVSARLMRGLRKRKIEQKEDPQEQAQSKKQRVTKATVAAVDVMNKLLAPDGDVGYDVADDEWERLVELTQQHEKFQRLFNFPENEPGWVKTRAKKKPSHLKIVAVDCEMCVTASNATNEHFSHALCRVSAVNGENLLRNIISDFIVHQPEEGFHMVDPKTDLHGITPQQIAECKITMVKAQKKMLKYINKDTIVVGHSVSGDLASMRINHRRVIDTALIFQRKDGDPSRATPGLKDLTKFLLGFEMPDGHDSTVDAQASMMAAKYAVRHAVGSIIPSASELHGPRSKRNEDLRSLTEKIKDGLDQESLEYTGPAKLVPTAFDPSHAASNPPTNPTPIKVPVNGASFINMDTNDGPARRMSEAMIAKSCRLRVHRIPKGVTSRDIEKFFIETSKVVPSVVEQIVWLPKQNRGSCNITFSTNAHAALAFESAQDVSSKTKPAKDSIGRPQKAIAVVNERGKTFKNVTLVLL